MRIDIDKKNISTITIKTVKYINKNDFKIVSKTHFLSKRLVKYFLKEIHIFWKEKSIYSTRENSPTRDGIL